MNGVSTAYVQKTREAWDLLAEPNAPRLALLDWVLPEVDGVELCRRLCYRPETESYTYTILLTAKSRTTESVVMAGKSFS